MRAALVQVYGAVAALVRGDDEGAELLIDDLQTTYGETDELLVALSLVTLERLEATFRDRVPGGRGRPVAADLIGHAVGFGVAPGGAINAAAWRLDGVRHHDGGRAAHDVRRSRSAGDDRELVAGALALLAATVVAGAQLAGRNPVTQSQELCLAAAEQPLR